MVFCCVCRFWYKRVKSPARIVICCLCTLFNEVVCFNGTPTCMKNKNIVVYTPARNSLWIIIKMCPFQHVGVSSEEDHVPEVQHMAAAPHDPLCRPRWWCRGESVAGSTELLGSHWYISVLSFRNWGTKQTLSISRSNLSTDSKATYKWYHLFICCLVRSDLCPVSPLLLPDNKGGTVTIFWLNGTKVQQV